MLMRAFFGMNFAPHQNEMKHILKKVGSKPTPKLAVLRANSLGDEKWRRSKALSVARAAFGSPGRHCLAH